MRGFNEKTRNDYVRHVRAFAAFIGRSPDTATAEDLRRFQLHQTQSGMQPPSINSAVSALRFFFTVTLDRPDLARRLTVVRVSAPAAGGAQRRGGDAAAAGGTGAEVQGGVRHRLRRRAARLRSRRAQGRRYRFRAHAAAGRARQGTQGPPRHAVAAAARTAARLVARGAAARLLLPRRLAVSRPQPGRAAVDPPAQPRRPRRRRGRRDQEAGVAAHAAAQLRHAPARTGHRHPRHPGAARPRQARHHGALHPRRQHHDPHRDQPARPARAADRREAETRRRSRRPCAARGWRSQTSFIAMGPTGAEPMPGM